MRESGLYCMKNRYETTNNYIPQFVEVKFETSSDVKTTDILKNVTVFASYTQGTALFSHHK